MRPILATHKEADEVSPLKRGLIAYRPAQHRIGRFECVENCPLSNGRFDLERNLPASMRQRAQMLGKNNSDHAFELDSTSKVESNCPHVNVCTSTDKTAGKSRTMACQ